MAARVAATVTTVGGLLALGPQGVEVDQVLQQQLEPARHRCRESIRKFRTGTAQIKLYARTRSEPVEGITNRAYFHARDSHSP